MPGNTKVGAAKKRSAKTGFPPGFLIHIGEKHAEKVKITLREYDETFFREKEVSTLEGVLPPLDRSGVAWIHIDGLQDIPLLEQVGSIFNLHPLTLEDILNTDNRPKCEDHDTYYYIVLRLFSEDAEDGFVPEQISIVFGTNWLISLQEKEGKLFDPIRERLRNEKGRLRKAGADYLAHALLDAIVDSLFPILDKFGEKVEILEEKLVGRPSPEILRAIQTLKREMIFLRKSTWPLREMIGGIARSDSPLIRESSVIYRYDRDLSGHALRDARHLPLLGQQSDERDHESPDAHRDHLHAPDLSCRCLWDEFQTHAGAGVAMGILRPLGADGGHCAHDVGIFPTKKMALITPDAHAGRGYPGRDFISEEMKHGCL
jgi:magnesium transporter